MKEWCNTHFYDGKLTTPLSLPQLSLQQCLEEITLAGVGNATALQALTLFVDEAATDDLNNLNISTVLRVSWQCVRDTELIPLYLEQLSDIVTSGSCAQGRTTRLVQFIYSQ